MTDEEVIDKAIELLRAGWAKYNSHTITKTGRIFKKEHHSYCATGALNAAVQNGEFCKNWDQQVQYNRLENLLNFKLRESFGDSLWRNIQDYNDSVATDVEDVIIIFEKARAELD